MVKTIEGGLGRFIEQLMVQTELPERFIPSCEDVVSKVDRDLKLSGQKSVHLYPCPLFTRGYSTKVALWTHAPGTTENKEEVVYIFDLKGKTLLKEILKPNRSPIQTSKINISNYV